MAKIEANEVEAQDEALALSALDNTQLANTTERPFVGFSGEVDATDYQLPYLRVWSSSCAEAQERIGKLGDLMIGSTVVSNSQTPLTCICLHARKYFKEHIDYNDQREGYPQVWPSEEAYRADGYERDQIDRVLEMYLLAKKPSTLVADTTSQDDLDAMFTIDLMGEKWMLIRYFAQGNSYANVAKPLITFIGTTRHPQGILPFRIEMYTTKATSTRSVKPIQYAKPALRVKPRAVEGQVEALLESGILNSIPNA